MRLERIETFVPEQVSYDYALHAFDFYDLHQANKQKQTSKQNKTNKQNKKKNIKLSRHFQNLNKKV